MGISDRFGRRADSGPRAGAVGRGRSPLLDGGIALAAVGALAAAALAGGGPALAAGKPGLSTGRAAQAPAVAATPPPADGYQFVQLGSHKDRTYNSLTGINNHGRIAGSYGSGIGSHTASKGYTINAPYAQGDIKVENFPHSTLSVVEGLNDNNVQVGYYSTQNKKSGTDNSFGWYYNGSFHEVVYPTGNNAKPTQDDLNAVNNHDIAVGSYLNGSDRYRGYTYNIKTRKFALVTKPGAPTGGSAPSLVAFGINNPGDVVGEYTASGGIINGFIKLTGGAFHTIAVPGAIETVALGVNDNDTVVGAYVDTSGSTTTIHGFIWRIGGSLTTMVDDPNANGITILYDINNKGDIVGSYIDSQDHTDGLLAYPPF